MSTARVDFTRGAAERIARVVRLVEQGERDQTGPRYGRAGDGEFGGKALRLCTFTGAWPSGSSATVTFVNQTATPNTASVLNSLISLPDAGERKCVVGKEGTAWLLVNWQWNTAVAATAASLGTASLDFQGVPVGSLSPTSTNAFSVAVSSCVTSQASAQALAFFS